MTNISRAADEILIWGDPTLTLSGSSRRVNPPPQLTVFSSSPLLTTSAESACFSLARADAIGPLASRNNTQHEITTQNLILQNTTLLQPVGRWGDVRKRAREREGTSFCDFRSVFSLHLQSLLVCCFWHIIAPS